MRASVGHRCGHVVEWEADTTNEIAFGFFRAEIAAFPCPFCGGESGEPLESWQREVRFGSSVLPELVARREPPA